MRCFYDGSHQLVRAERSIRNEKGNEGGASTAAIAIAIATAVYRYDAFGRRIAKRQRPEEHAAITTLYYGWDGDRQVHTETHMDITHTVYKPGGFVPLLQLSRRKGAPSLTVIMLGDASDQMPRQVKDMIEKSFRGMDDQGLARMAAVVDAAQAQAFAVQLQGVRDKKREVDRAYRVQVRHYHCDHLGTPIG